MAVEPSTAMVDTFEDIFGSPSVDKMLQLTWQQFEDFVQYVFECAGYAVEKVASQPKKHVDLLLRDHGKTKVLGKVEVRRYTPPQKISKPRVQQFCGAIGHSSVPGIMVTTSDFTSDAYEAVKEWHGQFTLINGAKLLRYITYLRGSRADQHPRPTGKLTAFLPDPIHPRVLLEGDEITHKASSVPRARILAIANNKGGVAKTTTALNLGFALATQQDPKQRVLVVDMDSQGSLTHSLPRESVSSDALHTERLTVTEFIGDGVDLSRVVRPTRFVGLSIAPSSPKLLHHDGGSGGRPEVELGYVRQLHQLAAQTDQNGALRYQWIIIDTPPAQSTFTRMALAAADFVLVPTFVDTFAVLGINAVVETLRAMHSLCRPDHTWQQQLIGCIITRWKSNRANEAERAQFTDRLAKGGVKVLDIAIPIDDRVEQAIGETSRGRLREIFHLGARQSPAAQAYTQLAKEIIEYGNQNPA